MTNIEFNKLWALQYPDTVPMSYLFKHVHSDRWFRIHSLPESKRYAENDADWEIILSRQNAIITDLFGIDSPVLLVTGEYNWGDQSANHITEEEEIFRSFEFTRLKNIDLHKIDPAHHEEPDTYRPAFTTTIWKPNYHDNLLREIAKDNVRAFFVSFEKNIIVAPYDGGVDFVLKDSLAKEYYKNKYRQWLSNHKDGF